ncbi:hypothetical protein HDV04_005903 [Boothiomyces sp. JEL0838]|nr:hypothetical protein HDV04_005903 [Boothiomyces sp. JEL0838]
MGMSFHLYFHPSGIELEAVIFLWSAVTLGIYLVNIQILDIFGIFRPRIITPDRIYVFKVCTIVFGTIVLSLRAMLASNVGLLFTVGGVFYDNIQASYLAYLVSTHKPLHGSESYRAVLKCISAIIGSCFCDWISLASFFLINYTNLVPEFYAISELFIGAVLAVHSSMMLLVFNSLVKLAFFQPKKSVSSTDSKDVFTSVKNLDTLFSTSITSLKIPTNLYPSSREHRESTQTIEWEIEV